MGSAASKWAQSGVDDVDSSFDGFLDGHLSDAAGAVGMKLDWELGVLLEFLDELIGIIWEKDAGHVFDAKGIGSEGLNLLGKVGIVFDGVDRGGGVA